MSQRPTRAGLAEIVCLLLLAGCSAGRASEIEVEQIADALSLRAGMRVADVGAGDGEWTEALAIRVGPEGKVWSTEVEEDQLDEIRERLERAGLTYVTPVLGDQAKTGLPERCCDAILLRLVYHHFTDPTQMLADLRRALRPGGRIAVVEIRIQPSWSELDGVPDRGGHGIEPEMLVEELKDHGWKVVDRIDDWGSERDHYCVVVE